ncbi:MAG: hypothetical protein ABIO70_02850 [Pseudomonadota bacterium]
MIPDTFRSMDPDPVEPVALFVAARADLGTVPPFRAGPRDRLGLALGGAWAPAARLVVDLRMEGLCDQHPDGDRTVGFGDAELGALVRLPVLEGRRATARAAGGRGPSLGLGWRVKLPNAADEGELGSDETDVALVLAAATDLGPLRAGLSGGLAILGDPFRLAAQDDLAFASLRLGWLPPTPPPKVWVPHGALALDLALPSPSNPLRARAGLALEWGWRWRLGLDVGAGLSPAAPDLALGLRLGWAAVGRAEEAAAD